MQVGSCHLAEALEGLSVAAADDWAAAAAAARPSFLTCSHCSHQQNCPPDTCTPTINPSPRCNFRGTKGGLVAGPALRVHFIAFRRHCDHLSAPHLQLGITEVAQIGPIVLSSNCLIGPNPAIIHRFSQGHDNFSQLKY